MFRNNYHLPEKLINDLPGDIIRRAAGPDDEVPIRKAIDKLSLVEELFGARLVAGERPVLV
jgi:hypothetical protein